MFWSIAGAAFADGAIIAAKGAGECTKVNTSLQSQEVTEEGGYLGEDTVFAVQ